MSDPTDGVLKVEQDITQLEQAGLPKTPSQTEIFTQRLEGLMTDLRNLSVRQWIYLITMLILVAATTIVFPVLYSELSQRIGSMQQPSTTAPSLQSPASTAASGPTGLRSPNTPANEQLQNP